MENKIVGKIWRTKSEERVVFVTGISALSDDEQTLYIVEELNTQTMWLQTEDQLLPIESSKDYNEHKRLLNTIKIDNAKMLIERLESEYKSK